MQLDADIQKFAANVLKKYPLMKKELEELQKQREETNYNAPLQNRTFI